MRARSFVNLGVAGAAIPDGFAVACRPMLPVLPDAAGFLVGTAIELVADDDRAAVRGGRATVGLKAGSAAAAATFSAETFNDEANATVSFQVGGRVTCGGRRGGRPGDWWAGDWCAGGTRRRGALLQNPHLIRTGRCRCRNERRLRLSLPAEQ